MLFGPSLRVASEIAVTDPYIRQFYQTRNLMEFLQTVVRHKAPDREVAVHLETIADQFRGDSQRAVRSGIPGCLGTPLSFGKPPHTPDARRRMGCRMRWCQVGGRLKSAAESSCVIVKAVPEILRGSAS